MDGPKSSLAFPNWNDPQSSSAPLASLAEMEQVLKKDGFV